MKIFKEFEDKVEKIKAMLLAFIKTINNLYVGSYRNLNPEDYEARARFYLDTSKLPRPFQVTLKKDDGWNLNSGWFDAEIKGAGEK